MIECFGFVFLGFSGGFEFSGELLTSKGMYAVCILENSSEKIYIGYTSKVERRLEEHNAERFGKK